MQVRRFGLTAAASTVSDADHPRWAGAPLQSMHIARSLSKLAPLCGISEQRKRFSSFFFS